MSATDFANVDTLAPDWPAPQSVHAAFTLRRGGVSAPPYDSLNVGLHVGDEVAKVVENRKRISVQLRLPTEPAWIEQVHGTDVRDLDVDAGAERCGPADAVVTHRSGRVCVIQVADCLPVLFTARDGSVAAAAHAGWRGLAAGVLEGTVAALGVEPEEIMAWVGPAISAEHFEVGDDVRQAFLAHDRGSYGAFIENPRGRWQCDLVALARRRLAASGVRAVYGGQWCTYAESSRFFSFRRDGRCGRMAALIWLA